MGPNTKAYFMSRKVLPFIIEQLDNMSALLQESDFDKVADLETRMTTRITLKVHGEEGEVPP